MVELLCDCNWDIPGVEQLPWHSHREHHVIYSEHLGAEMLWGGRWVEQPGYEVRRSWEELEFSVDWKAVARALTQSSSSSSSSSSGAS